MTASAHRRTAKIPHLHGAAQQIPAVRLCLLCVMLMAGCQSTPDKPDVSLPEPVLPPPPPPPSEPEPEPVLTSLNEIILALQDGDEAVAERSLQAMLAQGQNAGIADKLLQQIQTNPEQLLGAEHDTISVKVGDTLSLLAEKHLGDPLMFYALARYNSIDKPGQLQRGQSLNIPSNYARKGISSDNILPASKQERLATFLIASGERREGWQTLVQAALKQQLSAQGLQQLLALSLELAEASLAAHRGNDAIATLQSARAAFDDVERREQIDNVLLRMRARIKMQDSAEAASNSHLATAWQLAAEATDIDPGFTAASEAEARLKAELVQQLHENALRQWRDREVTQAIRLWEQLLTVKPDFEPAAVYLQRARAMAAKLDTSTDQSD